MRKKAVFGLAIGWTVMIAILCLIKFSKLPTVAASGIDKYVHFSFHFWFTMLWSYYFWLSSELDLKRIFQLVGISFVYGILIEFLQETLTTTRHADVFDVMANTAGALTALLLVLFIKKVKEK